MKINDLTYSGVGKRKTSVAKVFLKVIDDEDDDDAANFEL